MDIIICGNFIEIDIIGEQIRSVVPKHTVVNIQECFTEEQLVKAVNRKKFDGAIIALDGAEGLEGVNALREHQKSLPIIWMSNDEQFALISYRYKVTMFLTKPYQLDELEEAMIRVMEKHR